MRNIAHLAFASTQPALHLAPHTLWGRPTTTDRLGTTIWAPHPPSSGPCLDIAERCRRAIRLRKLPSSFWQLFGRPLSPANTAKIYPPREQAAAGAPAPPPGENGAPRLNAVTTYPYQQPTRPPPSPICQASPSTVEASPQRTPGPTRVRASVACLKCRSSKTKCDNEGEKSQCKACQAKNAECIYQSTTGSSVVGASRRESTTDGDLPAKKRQRKVAAHAPGVPIYSAPLRPRSVDGLGTYEDALESPLLTAEVWAELFGIYETHLAIDFPFFHRRVFLSCIRERPQIGLPSDSRLDASSAMPQPQYPPLLLAFLTQTARFCPKLIEHKNNNPIETANFYAEATRYHMGKCDFPGEPTLEKVQALLLLGYHEWTALQGRKGWVRIGTAIRCAQGLSYQFDADQDDRKPAMLKEPERRLSEKDQFILREIQRRTFWSCCLLDCYMSWGENRPRMLSAEDFQRIQLPCSKGAFEFGRKVRTRLLGETNAAYARRRNALRELAMRQHNQSGYPQQAIPFEEVKWEVEFEGELPWYITIVDLFGEIVKWSCSGGRRQEGATPPWDENTKFKKLENKLRLFKQELPDQLQLTAENNQDRVYNGSDNYLLIHALYTVCTVFLYREYMAMAPWAEKKPVGPLDEPLIRARPPTEDYWINQAQECWKVCKEFIDLLADMQSARRKSDLPQMPIVAFASFTVGLCTIYCHYFPNMDPARSLSSRRRPRAHDVAHNYLETILERFSMGASWVKQLASWQRYYRTTRERYKESGGKVGDSPQSSTSDSSGGGLKDYLELFEKTHKEFGNIHAKHDGSWTDKELDLADSILPQEDSHAERNASSNPTRLKRETEEVSMSKPVLTSGFTVVNPSKSSAADGNGVPANMPVAGGPCHGPHMDGNTLSGATLHQRVQDQSSFYNNSYHLPASAPFSDQVGYSGEVNTAPLNRLLGFGYRGLQNLEDFTPVMCADEENMVYNMYGIDPYYNGLDFTGNSTYDQSQWPPNPPGTDIYAYQHQPR